MGIGEGWEPVMFLTRKKEALREVVAKMQTSDFDVWGRENVYTSIIGMNRKLLLYIPLVFAKLATFFLSTFNNSTKCDYSTLKNKGSQQKEYQSYNIAMNQDAVKMDSSSSFSYKVLIHLFFLDEPSMAACPYFFFFFFNIKQSLHK